MLCKTREWLAPHALAVTALTDVSATVPPNEDANTEDTVGATSVSAVHAKEAEACARDRSAQYHFLSTDTALYI